MRPRAPSTADPDRLVGHGDTLERGVNSPSARSGPGSVVDRLVGSDHGSGQRACRTAPRPARRPARRSPRRCRPGSPRRCAAGRGRARPCRSGASGSRGPPGPAPARRAASPCPGPARPSVSPSPATRPALRAPPRHLAEPLRRACRRTPTGCRRRRSTRSPSTPSRPARGCSRICWNSRELIPPPSAAFSTPST